MTMQGRRPPLHATLRRIAVALFALATALAVPASAHADHWRHGHHRRHWHGGGWGPVYAAPRFYGPPAVVYAPAPVYVAPPPPVYVAPAPVYVAPPPPYAYYDGRPHV